MAQRRRVVSNWKVAFNKITISVGSPLNRCPRKSGEVCAQSRPAAAFPKHCPSKTPPNNLQNCLMSSYWKSGSSAGYESGRSHPSSSEKSQTHPRSHTSNGTTTPPARRSLRLSWQRATLEGAWRPIRSVWWGSRNTFASSLRSPAWGSMSSTLGRNFPTNTVPSWAY